MWKRSLEEQPDNSREILIAWSDNGITQGFYEDGKFVDTEHDYSCEPKEDIYWMDIPEFPKD